MRLQLVLKDRAELELLKGQEWYDEKRKGLGTEFRSAVRQCIQKIRSRPTVRPCHVRDIRRLKVDRFPYWIYYRVTTKYIAVLMVFHERRGPKDLESALEADPLPDPEPLA